MDNRRTRRLTLPARAIFVCACILPLIFLLNPPPPVVGQGDGELGGDEEFVELAPYMGQLQTLTHKLGLSVEHSNHRLAQFYLYESLEALEDMKTEVPEYRGHAIALLVDQLSTPAYKVLEAAIKEDQEQEEPTNRRSAAAFSTLVQTCNQCHAVTKHEFVKITTPKGANPFLQDFRPAAAP
mgnify:FL=1